MKKRNLKKNKYQIDLNKSIMTAKQWILVNIISQIPGTSPYKNKVMTNILRIARKEKRGFLTLKSINARNKAKFVAQVRKNEVQLAYRKEDFGIDTPINFVFLIVTIIALVSPIIANISINSQVLPIDYIVAVVASFLSISPITSLSLVIWRFLTGFIEGLIGKKPLLRLILDLAILPLAFAIEIEIIYFLIVNSTSNKVDISLLLPMLISSSLFVLFFMLIVLQRLYIKIVLEKRFVLEFFNIALYENFKKLLQETEQLTITKLSNRDLVQKLLDEIENTALLLSNHLPFRTNPGDLTTTTWVKQKTFSLAQGVRDLKKYILFPELDSDKELSRRLAKALATTLEGRLSELGEGEITVTARSRSEIIISTVRSIISAFVPLVLFVFIQRSTFTLSKPTSDYVLVACLLWIAVSLIIYLDPIFYQKLEALARVSDPINIINARKVNSE